VAFHLAVALFIGPGPSTVLADLYGITHNVVVVGETTLNDNRLITIDTTTGFYDDTLGVVGGMLQPEYPIGLADYNGELYTYLQVSDEVAKLDHLTGDIVARHDMGSADLGGEGAITFGAFGSDDPAGFLSTCEFGVHSYPSLWEFDLGVTWGPVIFKGDTTTNGQPDGRKMIDGLDFNGGELYGISGYEGVHGDQDDAMLYTIADDGTLTLVGTLHNDTGNLPYSALGGLTFDSDGTLYSVNNDKLYTISTTTAWATAIGSGIGIPNVSGISFLSSPAGGPGPAVPIPHSAWLLGIGLVGLVALRRRVTK
jgi:hypothetical protein